MDRKPGHILFGTLCIILAVAAVIGGFFLRDGETTAEPVPYSAALEEGTRVVVRPQFMSGDFATFAALESDRFYLLIDEDFSFYIACISDEDLAPYQAVIDYTYSEDGLAPPIVEVVGACVLLEEELIPFAVEAVNTLLGEEIVDEATLTELTGPHYIDTTGAASASRALPICLAAAAVLLALAAFLLIPRRPPVPKGEQLVEDGFLVERRPNYLLGALGALGGALLGGVLWAAVGVLGYIAGMIGAVIVWLTLSGFRLLGGRIDRAGAVLCVVLAVACIPLANLTSYAWIYADAMGARYSLLRALGEMPALLSENGLWSDFAKESLLGLVFLFLASWPILKRALAPVPAPAATAEDEPADEAPADEAADDEGQGR